MSEKPPQLHEYTDPRTGYTYQLTEVDAKGLGLKRVQVAESKAVSPTDLKKRVENK